MDSLQVYELLDRRPFQPMRVYLADGRSYDIALRRLAVVGTWFLDIGVQAEGEPEGVVETMITVPLKDIRRIEVLPATPGVTA